MTLGDLTMVMMTGNRPRMFRTIIERYAAIAPEVRIVVGDFGSAESQAENAASAARFPNHVLYIAYPPGLEWRERFPAIFEYVDTPLAVMAADDDLLLPEGLDACVTFMTEHQDYAACHGTYYEVMPGNEAGTLSLRVQSGFIGRGHESDDPVGRLISLLHWYSPIYYAVQRTRDLRRLVVPPEIYAGATTELFAAAVVAISGKIGRLNVPYYVRNTMPVTHTVTLTQFTDVVLLGSAKFTEEYLPARTRLVELLQESLPNDPRDWARLIDVASFLLVRSNLVVERAMMLLADSGDIPQADLPVVSRRGLESEPWSVPAEHLMTFIGPLLQSGWPNFG